MSAKTKLYLVAASFIGAFAALVVLGLLPLLKEIKRTSQGLVFQREVFRLFKSQRMGLEGLAKEYPSYQPILEKIKKGFVDAEVPINFIKFLELEAQKSKILIKISPSHIHNVVTYPWPSIGFSVSVGGPFPSSLSFLEKIETGPFLVEVSQLNVNRIEKKQPRGIFESLAFGDTLMTIALKVFTRGTLPH